MKLRFEKQDQEIDDHVSALGVYEYNEDTLIFEDGALTVRLDEVRCYGYADHGGDSETIFYTASLYKPGPLTLIVTLDRMREVGYIGTSIEQRSLYVSHDSGQTWEAFDDERAAPWRRALAGIKPLMTTSAI